MPFSRPLSLLMISLTSIEQLRLLHVTRQVGTDSPSRNWLAKSKPSQVFFLLQFSLLQLSLPHTALLLVASNSASHCLNRDLIPNSKFLPLKKNQKKVDSNPGRQCIIIIINKSVAWLIHYTMVLRFNTGALCLPHSHSVTTSAEKPLSKNQHVCLVG